MIFQELHILHLDRREDARATRAVLAQAEYVVGRDEYVKDFALFIGRAVGGNVLGTPGLCMCQYVQLMLDTSNHVATYVSTETTQYWCVARASGRAQLVQ
jgi:hypothetical protein